MGTKLQKRINISGLIHYLRNEKVILDRDLAFLYDVETRALKQAVKRNIKRFPKDFLFTLNKKEIDFLVSQNVIPSKKYLGGAYPYAFTEQGVAMLSSILNSEKAIEVNIEIMRAFVKLRKAIDENKEISEKLKELEFKIAYHDEQFSEVFEAIRQLLLPPEPQRKHIGFTLNDKIKL